LRHAVFLLLDSKICPYAAFAPQSKPDAQALVVSGRLPAHPLKRIKGEIGSLRTTFSGFDKKRVHLSRSVAINRLWC